MSFATREQPSQPAIRLIAPLGSLWASTPTQEPSGLGAASDAYGEIPSRLQRSSSVDLTIPRVSFP
jgi:hypothetical protein